MTKIALVHDYLKEAGGAERVLAVLAEMYPDAPIYTAFADRNGTAIKMLGERSEKIEESGWAWFLKIGRMYSYCRFLLPWVWGGVDSSKYDLVITSCSGYIARGFRVGKKTKVVAYCHTPPRWLYGYDVPTGANKKWWGQMFMTVFGPFMRYFDFTSAQRVDVWIANSHEVAGRIEKFYRAKSTVVYPPVDLKFSSKEKQLQNGKTAIPRDYYLVVSRLVGGKGIAEAIAGAAAAGVKLKVVGETITPLNHYTIVKNNNVEYLGRVGDEELGKLYVGAKGFIALAQDEDFGITVVEAMAAGTPVLAYYGGGYKETVVDGKTGIFVKGTDVESVAGGIRKMEKIKWDREAIREWATKFSRENFENGIRETIKPLNY